MSELSIVQQIKCIEREIRMRQRVYPRWIEAGRMTQEKADHEIACMKAVRKTLLKAAEYGFELN